MDVCPFIPVQNVSMDDCVNCANVFGQKLAEMLHVPGEMQIYIKYNIYNTFIIKTINRL